MDPFKVVCTCTAREAELVVEVATQAASKEDEDGCKQCKLH